MNRNKFIEKVKNDGFVFLDENAEYKYWCLKINESNFKNMPETLIEQLKNDDYYDNGYIGVIVHANENPPLDYHCMPVFGDPNKWVTKWIWHNIDDAIKSTLNDRMIKLLKRANEFEEASKKEKDSDEEIVDMR